MSHWGGFIFCPVDTAGSERKSFAVVVLINYRPMRPGRPKTIKYIYSIIVIHVNIFLDTE